MQTNSQRQAATRASSALVVTIGEWCCLDLCIGSLSDDSRSADRSSGGPFTGDEPLCGMQLLLELSKQAWQAPGRLDPDHERDHDE
jgi:hypothetical protein